MFGKETKSRMNDWHSSYKEHCILFMLWEDREFGQHYCHPGLSVRICFTIRMLSSIENWVPPQLCPCLRWVWGLVWLSDCCTCRLTLTPPYSTVTHHSRCYVEGWHSIVSTEPNCSTQPKPKPSQIKPSQVGLRWLYLHLLRYVMQHHLFLSRSFSPLRPIQIKPNLVGMTS
jgi:hypothetical protein